MRHHVTNETDAHNDRALLSPETESKPQLDCLTQVVKTVQVANVEAGGCPHLERLLADIISAEAISECHYLPNPLERVIRPAGYQREQRHLHVG
jgi:hypothetical protein